jgi:hypothetical protein
MVGAVAPLGRRATSSVVLRLTRRATGFPNVSARRTPGKALGVSLVSRADEPAAIRVRICDVTQRGRMFMRRFLVVVAGIAVIALTVTLPATAAPPENCWGVVTSQRATSVGDVGEHSSSFAGEPRLGLGNVARLFSFDSVGDLGSFLASVDDIEATSCP